MKSQVTPFIIIGLVLLAGVTAFLVIKEGTANKKTIIPADISPVNSYVQNCIEKTFIDGIDYISQKGGYYDTPDNAIDMEIPYYLYKKQNYMPSKEKVEEELGSYVNNELQFCLNEFNDLTDFNIEAGNASSVVKIENDTVLLKVNYPISISKGDKTYVLDEFDSSYKVRLGIVYDVAKQIVDGQTKGDEGICIGCLYDLSVKNDVSIKTLDYEGDMIYTITDENSKVNDKALVFNFINKYN